MANWIDLTPEVQAEVRSVIAAAVAEAEAVWAAVQHLKAIHPEAGAAAEAALNAARGADTAELNAVAAAGGWDTPVPAPAPAPAPAPWPWECLGEDPTQEEVDEWSDEWSAWTD